MERRALAWRAIYYSLAHMHRPNARRPQAVVGIRVRRPGVPGRRNGGWDKAAMALAPALGACSAGDKPDRPRGPCGCVADAGQERDMGRPFHGLRPQFLGRTHYASLRVCPAPMLARV